MSQEFTMDRVLYVADMVNINSHETAEIVGMLKAYAATLRQPAARVDEGMVERAVDARILLLCEQGKDNVADNDLMRAALEAALSAQPAPEFDGTSNPNVPEHDMPTQPAPERQGAVFGYIGFREQTTMERSGYAQVLSRPLPELGITTPLYTHPAAPVGVPDDAQDAKRWRHVWKNAMVMRDIGNLHYGDVEYPSIEEIDTELAAAPSAPQGTQQGEKG